jgi:hypothetical protein
MWDEIRGEVIMVRGHTREEEIGMMSHPDRWPHTVVLPVKRRVEGQSRPEVGFLRQLSLKTPAPAPEPVVYRTFTKEESPWRYDSIEAIVDDGWVVD